MRTGARTLEYRSWLDVAVAEATEACDRRTSLRDSVCAHRLEISARGSTLLCLVACGLLWPISSAYSTFTGYESKLARKSMLLGIEYSTDYLPGSHISFVGG